MKIDADAIRELADLLEETGLTEIETTEGDQSIRVSKGGVMMPAAAPAATPITMPSDPTIPQEGTGAYDNHPGAVNSPMVGTAYMAAEPGAAPFISKGASVTEGDTILIIEAMKVMNPIKAPKSGTISEIMVENGTPIEFGDILVVIE